MKWGTSRPYGLGLSRDGHIAFVAAYITAVLLLAAFGAWRFYSSILVLRELQANAAVLAKQAAAREQARFLHRSFYPLIALRLHQQGKVLVTVHVLADGTVGDAHILKSSGSPHLDAAALISVGFWRYKPAISHGKPVPADHEVNIEYRLDGTETASNGGGFGLSAAAN